MASAQLLGPMEHMGFEPCFHSGKTWLAHGCGWLALAGGPVPAAVPPPGPGSYTPYTLNDPKSH